MSSSPRSNPTRWRSASRDSPRWGALDPIAATSTGSGTPNRPSSSRVHRKREFGDGVLAGTDGALTKSAVAARSGCGASRSFAGARRLVACDAERRNRQQKPGRAARPGNADAAQIDADRPAVDDDAYRLETRRLANGKRRRQMPKTARRRSLASNQPSLQRLAILDAKQGEHGRARAHDKARGHDDRQPRLAFPPFFRRAPLVEGHDGLVARQRREAGGGRWRRVGQSRRSRLNSNRRSRIADDSGFIVSESLTWLLNFRHGVGVPDCFQG